MPKLTLRYLARLAADNADGAPWYDIAQREIEAVCEARGWAADKFTAILAVTSPRVSVRRNARITLHYMQTGRLFSNCMGNIRQSLNHYLATGEIKGPKTGPFYSALRGDSSAIVLDTHMAGLFGVAQSKLTKRSVRAAIVASIQAVANRVAMSPRDCQAALWAGRLRSMGRNPTGLSILQESANQQAYGEFPDGGAIQQRGSVDGSYQLSFFGA